MEWLEDNRIKVTPTKKPKKLTATRFASILGLNPWASPFKTWCEITKTYQEPFEDTIYTIAGKTIEPKQAQYMKKSYFMENLLTPTDKYGKDYFNKTFGDFFPDEKIFGGMWDYLDCDDSGNPTTVLEMKTTKRAEDWEDDVPEYYALQAALYAYLLGIDNVMMVASFLEDTDYQNPEKFKPSAKNTIIIPFKVSERYPDFKKTVKKAEKWWKDHVETGISPAFDEKQDADILKELRKNTLNPETEISSVIAEAEELTEKIDAHNALIAEDEKRLKTLKDIIKEKEVKEFRDGDKKVSMRGNKFDWVVSKTVTKKLDEDALKRDGLYDKYCTKETVTYRLTNPAIKENGNDN